MHACAYGGWLMRKAAPRAAEPAAMKTFPKNRKPDPTERTTATPTKCFASRPTASNPEAQKEVPWIIMTMYALRET